MTYEGVRLRILKIVRDFGAKYRRKNLKNQDFTIISNNCWGGMIYESYNLPKKSPTVGCFFMASDYIKFVSNLHEYLESNLKFIDPNDSKWKDELCKDKRFGSYPIALLRDIEIFFLHYHSEEEVMEKWNRRCKRINWDNILIKFNDQNGCTHLELEQFIKLPYKNKIFFTCKQWDGYSENKIVNKVNQIFQYDFVMASYEPFGFKITKLLNSMRRER